MDATYANYYTREVMVILIREFQVRGLLVFAVGCFCVDGFWRFLVFWCFFGGGGVGVFCCFVMFGFLFAVAFFENLVPLCLDASLLS